MPPDASDSREMERADLDFRAHTSAFDDLGELLVDIIGLDGRVLWANEKEARMVGLPREVLDGLLYEALYAPSSATAIATMLRQAVEDGPLPSCELTLVGRGGRSIRTLARPRYVVWDGETALALSKMDYGVVGLRHAERENDLRLLSHIVQDSTEAHWAIVFLEPVDTTQPRAEVIRQIFENQSVWRMCNRPMARLYELPDDTDLNTQQVRLYWPRSAANERFVGQIIDANYEIDDALSIDSRHDGTPVYIRNDVRAEIVDGFLKRLWGNCRDITDQHKSESDSAERMDSLRRVLDAVPDAVIVLDETGAVVTRNRVFKDSYGADSPLEQRLGRQVVRQVARQMARQIAHQHAIDAQADDPEDDEIAPLGRPLRKGWRVMAATRAGAGILKVHWDQVPGVGEATWNVLVLRPEGETRGAPGRILPPPKTTAPTKAETGTAGKAAAEAAPKAPPGTAGRTASKAVPKPAAKPVPPAAVKTPAKPDRKTDRKADHKTSRAAAGSSRADKKAEAKRP